MLKILFLTKWQLCELRQFLRLVLNMVYVCAVIVHTRADQLLSQILMEQFETLPSQYRHIGHLYEEVDA